MAFQVQIFMSKQKDFQSRLQYDFSHLQNNLHHSFASRFQMSLLKYTFYFFPLVFVFTFFFSLK